MVIPHKSLPLIKNCTRSCCKNYHTRVICVTQKQRNWWRITAVGTFVTSQLISAIKRGRVIDNFKAWSRQRLQTLFSPKAWLPCLNVNTYIGTGVGNKRPAGHMWPATAFLVARENIQEKYSNLKVPLIYHRKR